MANKLITLRIPEALLKKSKQISEERMFGNLTDFIRNAIRNYIEEYEMRKTIKSMDKLRGSVKKRGKGLTAKEREGLFKEFLKEKAEGKNFFKEVGL